MGKLKLLKIKNNLSKFLGISQDHPPINHMPQPLMANGLLLMAVAQWKRQRLKPLLHFFSFKEFYIAPIQGNLLRGAHCAGLYDVKCHYE